MKIPVNTTNLSLGHGWQMPAWDQEAPEGYASYSNADIPLPNMTSQGQMGRHLQPEVWAKPRVRSLKVGIYWKPERSSPGPLGLKMWVKT